MNQKYVSAFSLLALAILTGCTQGNAPAPATEATPAVAEPAPAPEPVAAPIPAKGANGLLTATPGSAGCDAGIEVNVAWGIGTTPAVSEVDLLVSKDADTKLFVSGGASGQAATGPWVYSGTTFVLRSRSDQTELDRVQIGGPACMPPAAEEMPVPVPDNAP